MIVFGSSGFHKTSVTIIGICITDIRSYLRCFCRYQDNARGLSFTFLFSKIFKHQTLKISPRAVEVSNIWINNVFKLHTTQLTRFVRGQCSLSEKLLRNIKFSAAPTYSITEGISSSKETALEERDLSLIGNGSGKLSA